MTRVRKPVAPQIGSPVAKPIEESGQRTSAFDRAIRNGSVKRGMILMALAMFLLPTMDAISKILSTQYGVTPGQITFGRFLVQASLLGPLIAVMMGPKAIIPKHWRVNLVRGAIMSMAVLLFNVTLRYMPIADAIAVFFLEPLILTILSVFLLGETVGWRRTMAVVVGFVGAMFIVQPSYEVFGPVSLLPIGTAFLFAIYLIYTRKFAGDDDPLAMQFTSGIGGVLMLGVVMTFGTMAGIEDISAPGLPEFGIRWGLIFAIGAIAAVGHLMVVVAFRMVSASVLAPFQYIEIVAATFFGFWLFGDFPDALKWLGIAIIVGSGLYIFLRESKSE